MDSGPRPFQIATIAFFIVLIIIGVILFVTYEQSPAEGELFGRVTIWGTLDATVMARTISAVREDYETFGNVSYRQIDERNFEDVLVNAIAEGNSPDMILIPQTELVDLRTKLQPISYELFPARDFKDRFIDGAEVYLLPEGVYAVPLLVDPLVMYWNRDILASNNFAGPPQTWEAVVNDYVPSIVVRDFNRNIRLSPIALGEYRNINNAFGILSTLLLQAGSRMVEFQNGRYQVELDRSVNAAVSKPLTRVYEFYTSFATANNPLYSWNRVQAPDQNAFAAGDLALYFGYGSEYSDISRLNPNLNFDIADMPQQDGTNAARTFGRIYGLAILKAAPNKNSAYSAMNTMTSDRSYLEVLYNGYDMAPAERSLLRSGTIDPIDQVRYRMAIIAHGWLNPNLPTTENVFQQAVEDILSLRSNVGGAVRDTIFRIGEAF